jgi:ribosomal protein S12 methylthiotransferase accessory factor
MPRLGITACEDATAGDVLGVPVWFSHRPRSQVRTVHSGKGVHGIEAEAGALMEAIEFAVAERAEPCVHGERTLLGDITAQFGPKLTVADLAPRFGAAVPPERRVLTDWCEDVATGAVLQMPAELLRLQAPDIDALGPAFGSSTNGLASGNSLEEATLHALLEVLERDCHALDMAAPSTRWIDVESMPEPFADWSARWSALGISLGVRQLLSEFGLPCFEARVTEDAAAGQRSGLGWGLHPDPRIALARAITEAAQCRLYAMRIDGHDVRPNTVVAARASDPHFAFESVQGKAFDTVSSALADVLARLRDRGLPWVLRRPMNLEPGAADLDGLHVVKVLVPGCESAVAGPLRIGRRLAQRLVQAAA